MTISVAKQGPCTAQTPRPCEWKSLEKGRQAHSVLAVMMRQLFVSERVALVASNEACARSSTAILLRETLNSAERTLIALFIFELGQMR